MTFDFRIRDNNIKRCTLRVNQTFQKTANSTVLTLNFQNDLRNVKKKNWPGPAKSGLVKQRMVKFGMVKRIGQIRLERSKAAKNGQRLDRRSILPRIGPNRPIKPENGPIMAKIRKNRTLLDWSKIWSKSVNGLAKIWQKNCKDRLRLTLKLA